MDFFQLIHELDERYGERLGRRDRSIDIATEDFWNGLI